MKMTGRRCLLLMLIVPCLIRSFYMLFGLTFVNETTLEHDEYYNDNNLIMIQSTIDNTTTSVITKNEVKPRVFGIVRPIGAEALLDFLMTHPHIESGLQQRQYSRKDNVLLQDSEHDACFFISKRNKSDSTEHKQSCPFSSYQALTRYYNQTQLSMEMQPFTIVQDPFDRLMNIFDSIQQHCNSERKYGKKMLTTNQYQCVCNNDLEGFLKLLQEEGGGLTLGIPYQYQVLNRNLETATSLIRQDKVLVLVKECWQQSLQLIQHKLAIHKLVVQDEEESYDDPTRPQQTAYMKNLRRSAEKWFANDFTFYNEALIQFQRHLENHGLNTTSCPPKAPLQTKKSSSSTTRTALRPVVNATMSTKTTIRGETSHVPFQNATKLLGFIRIQKTGSSAMLYFMHFMSQLYTWDNWIINHRELAVQASKEREAWKQRRIQVTDCVFGDTPTNVTDMLAKKESAYNTCPHYTLTKLEQAFTWTLGHTNAADHYDYKNTFQPFTIVRDPVDRLQSFYFFVQKFCKTTGAWKDLFPRPIYAQICANRIQKWAELMASQYTPTMGEDLRYQYKFLHSSVKGAIDLLRGQQPRVYVLINECFEESLRFMETKFQLQPGVSDAFLNSSKYRVNTNQLRPNSPANQSKLRQRMRQFLEPDYKFYNAAVKEFRQHLQSVGLVKDSMKNPCFLWDETEET